MYPSILNIQFNHNTLLVTTLNGKNSFHLDSRPSPKLDEPAPEPKLDPQPEPEPEPEVKSGK